MKQDIFNEASNKDINTENINKNNVKIGRYSDYINGSKAFTLTKYHIEFILTKYSYVEMIDNHILDIDPTEQPNDRFTRENSYRRF